MVEEQPDLVAPGIQDRISDHRGALVAVEVVVPGWNAVVQVDRPTVEAASLADDDALGSAFGHLQVGPDQVRPVLEVQHRPLWHAHVGRRVGHPGQPGQRAGCPGLRRNVHGGIAQRVHAVAQAFGVEQVLHLGQQLGPVGGEVPTLGEVLPDVVQLPLFLRAVERRRAEAHPRHPPVEAGGHEAVVVDAPVAHHLEVLGSTGAGRLRIAERVAHRRALDRHLPDAVHRRRCLDAGRLQDGRCQVDDVVELGAQAAAVGDPPRPGDGQAVAGAAEVGGDLLHPLEGCVQGPCPADVVVAFAPGGSEVVDVLEQEFRILLGTVLEGRQRPRAVDAPLGRGSVVPGDVDEERVVPFAHRLDGLDESGDLGVGVGEEGGEHLHEAAGHRLEPVRVFVPRRDHVGSRRVDRVGRDHPQIQLPLEDVLPQVVPTLVEEPLKAVQPGIGHVQRRMDGAGGEVAEEGPVRSVRLDPLHPVDCPVGDVLCEVVVAAPEVGGYGGGLVVQVGLELGGLGPREPVEAVESQPGGPPVEWPRRTHLPLRREVALAEHAGGIAVLSEDLGDGGRLTGDDRVVGREAVGRLGDPSHVHRVVVAAGQKRGTRRRADRGRVELVEPQPVRGNPLQGRRRNRPTERGERPEAHVVEQHDHHVGGAFRGSVKHHPGRLAIVGEPARGTGVRRRGAGDG